MSALTRILSMFVLVLVVGGCATSGPKFSEAGARSVTNPNAETARIYLYRTVLLGAAVQPEVKVNGVVVGRAVPRGYFFVDQPPGACEITTTTEVERKLSLTLEKGQVRYVKLSIGLGFFVGHVYPELIDSEIALREIQNLRFTGN